MKLRSIEQFYENLGERSQANLDNAISRIVEAKRRNGKVMLVIGSGPRNGDSPTGNSALLNPFEETFTMPAR